MSPSTSCAGRGIERESGPSGNNTQPSITTAWEYGPIALGGLIGDDRLAGHRLIPLPHGQARGLDDLVRAQAARADTQAADAAVDQRADGLQVGLEAAGRTLWA